MDFHSTVSMLVVLILLCVAAFSQAAFIMTPTSINATLGPTATFNCSASTGVIAWIVDGSLLTELNTRDITTSNDGNTFAMHIPATEEYNNTEVTCAVAILGGEDLYSEPVVLRVQGEPAAVSNLASANMTTVIRLTWDAPFTLDITGVEPDISYCVNISVVTVANNTDSTPLTTNCSVYMPMFNFTMDYPNTNTSVIYEFQVTPRNGAGEGPTSAPVSGFFSGQPANITADMVEVSVSVKPLEVNLTISYVGGIPPGEVPNNFSVNDGQNDANCSNIPFTLNSNGMVFIRLNESTCGSGLVHHRRYKAIITAKNLLGAAQSEEIPFSTHDIQKFDANNCSTGGRINVSCTFAEESRAMGYLSILCPNSSQEIFAIANRTNFFSTDLNISIPEVPPGDYVVTVFDLESNGLPVLSNDTNPYIQQSAGKRENINVTEQPENIEADDNDNISVIQSGTLMEVPDPAMDTEVVQVCASFQSNASSGSDGGRIVVLAHDAADPTKLWAYSPPDNQCFRAPAVGSYYFAVFIYNGTLELPASLPEIRIRTVFTSSPVSSPSVTPTTITTAPAPSSLVATAAVIVLFIVVVVIAAFVIVLVLIKKGNCKMHNLEQIRKTMWVQTGSNSIEEVNLDSYQSAENGENQLRIVADGDETETAGEIPARKSPTYAAVEPIKLTCSVPPTDWTVKYSSIDQQQTAKLQTCGPVYADVNPLPGKTKPPARDDRVQYSAILPQPLVTAPSIEPTAPPLPAKGYVTSNPPSSQRCSLNLENLISEVHPMNPKWQKFGEMLGMDEDLLDEIYTNHERDEEGLRDMLEMWFKKSENPTWRAVTDALRKIGESQLAESLYLKCTLPGMVGTPPPRASPEPATTSDMTHILDEGMKQMDSSDPSHYAKDPSPDEAQASSDEKENVCSARKDSEAAHSDSESSTYADAIDGETTHPSVEETENKGGEYHGKLHSLRHDSADSGILIEEAKQEEGESGIPVSNELVSRRTEVESSQAEQLQSESAYKGFRGCTEENSTRGEVKVSQESIKDLLTGQAIAEASVVDKNSCTLVVGLPTYSRTVRTTAIGCTWSTEPPICPVLDTEANQSCAVPTLQSNESQLIPVESIVCKTVWQLDYTDGDGSGVPGIWKSLPPHYLDQGWCTLERGLCQLAAVSEGTNQDAGTCVGSELADAAKTGENEKATRIISTKIVKGPRVTWSTWLKSWLEVWSKWQPTNRHRGPGVSWSSATRVSQLLELWLKSWLKLWLLKLWLKSWLRRQLLMFINQ